MSEMLKSVYISQKVYEMLEYFANNAGKSVDQLAVELLEIDLTDIYKRTKKIGPFKAKEPKSK